MHQFTRQLADDLYRQRLAHAGTRRLLALHRAARRSERAERRTRRLVRRTQRLRAPAQA